MGGKVHADSFSFLFELNLLRNQVSNVTNLDLSALVLSISQLGKPIEQHLDFASPTRSTLLTLFFHVLVLVYRVLRVDNFLEHDLHARKYT